MTNPTSFLQARNPSELNEGTASSDRSLFTRFWNEPDALKISGVESVGRVSADFFQAVCESQKDRNIQRLLDSTAKEALQKTGLSHLKDPSPGMLAVRTELFRSTSCQALEEQIKLEELGKGNYELFDRLLRIMDSFADDKKIHGDKKSCSSPPTRPASVDLDQQQLLENGEKDAFSATFPI